MKVEQYKKSFPEFANMSDVELGTRLYNMYYQASDMGYHDFLDKFGVKAAPIERGFFGKVAESYKRGRDSTLADVAIYEAASKGMDETHAKRMWHESRAKDRLDKIDSHLLGDMVYGSSRLVGQMVQSMKRGGIGALVVGGVGAGIGALAGAVLPTVGEEPLTVAAGAKAGLSAGVKLGLAEGAALFMYKQGTGQMYMNMTEAGVDRDMALKIAGIYGMPYAIVEAAQVKQAAGVFAAPVKEAIEQATKRSAIDIAKRLGVKYAKTMGTEIGEEVIQEAIQIAAEDTAQIYGGFGIDVDATYLEQRMHRMLITAKESTIAMALLPVPGTAWNASVEMAVNQNLMEEDAANSLKHEGHREQVQSWDQLSHLTEDQRDVVAGIMDDMGLTLDEATEALQHLSTNDFLLSSMDERVIAHNVEDAVNAVRFGSTFDIDTKEAKLADLQMREQGKAVVAETGDVVGLAEAKWHKKAMKKMGQGIANYGLRHTRIRNLLRRLDGSEFGVLRTLIWKPLRAATSLGATKRVIAAREFKNTLDTIGLKLDDIYKKNVTMENGQVWSQAEMLEVYMAQFDADKLRHLQKGNKMTIEQMNEVLENIDPRVADLGNWMLMEYDTGHQAISDVYEAIHGKPLPKINGYSQIFADEGRLTRTVDYAELVDKEMDRRGYHKRKVTDDMTKERTRSIAPLRLDAVSNFVEHKMQTEWYKAVAPQAFKVGKILNDKNFQSAINDKTHGIGSQLMSKWLQDVASERTTLETSWAGHVMNVLRQNGVVAALGFNVLSMMRQPLSTFIAMSEDPRLITGILKNFAQDFTGDSKKMRDFVWGKSDMVRTRSMERELRKVWRGKDARAVLQRKPGLSEVSLTGIKFMDQHTVTVIWKSAYELAQERGLTDQQSIDYADGLVEKTQPMADIMDLPAFFRGSTWEKTFSVFQNQINQNVNYWRDDVLGAYKTGQIGKGMLAYRVLFSMLLPAFLMGMITRGRPPEDKKEVVQDISSYGVAPAFMFGQFASAIIQGYGVRMPMGLGMFEEMGKAAKSPGQAPKRLAGAAAQALGLPWSQPRRTVEGLIALGDGETSDARRLIWNEYALEKTAEKKATKGKITRRSRRGRNRRNGRR